MKRGFTLIELLVVVAIIAILMAVLLPSLARARELSKGVYCLNNLRMMALANETYADECNNWYVPIRALGDANYTAWFKRPLYRQTLNVKNDSTYPTTYPRNLICPDATYALSHPLADQTYQMLWTYGMNVTGLTDAAHNPLLSEGTYGFKRNQVFSPASRFMVMDATDWWVGVYNSQLYLTYGEVASNGSTYTMAAAYRHNQTINIGFFDGHAENLPMRSVNYIYNVSGGNLNKIRMWFPAQEFSY